MTSSEMSATLLIIPSRQRQTPTPGARDAAPRRVRRSFQEKCCGKDHVGLDAAVRAASASLLEVNAGRMEEVRAELFYTRNLPSGSIVCPLPVQNFGNFHPSFPGLES